MKTRYRVQFRDRLGGPWLPLKTPHGLFDTRAEAEKLVRQISSVMLCDLRIVEEVKSK